MAAGQPITVAVSIGDPLTGTIKGSTVVAAPSTGNNPINIDQVVSLATTPTGDQTIYASDIVDTKIQALGFVATLVTAGTGTAGVVVNLKAAGSEGADVTYTPTPTQGSPNGVVFASLPAAVVGNITSIACTPSADGAVVEVTGKIYVTT